jgi:ubiquinone/menaquinone biosynthesis C-methylase UbiE
LDSFGKIRFSMSTSSYSKSTNGVTYPLDPEKYKQKVAETYNLMADGYDRLRFVRLPADRLVEQAEFQPGECVLDVATGTGHVALAAAKLVGAEGRVVGIDIAADMLGKARQLAVESGLNNIELRQEDAQKSHCQNQEFNVVMCASSLYLMPDQMAVLKEWYRVLKPGGRVLLSTFGANFLEPMASMFEEQLRASGLVISQSNVRKSLSNPEDVYRLLVDAGFERIAVWTEQLGYYLTPEEYWEETSNSMSRRQLERLTADQVELFKAQHLAEVSRLAGIQGIWQDVPVIFVTARKPAFHNLSSTSNGSG